MRTTLTLSAAALLACSALAACDHNKQMAENDSYCKSVKPGVVTTPNKMCVVMLEDPVNPATEPVMYKGQKYGLCCEGCRGKWNKMTDAQKETQIERAMAASR